MSRPVDFSHVTFISAGAGSGKTYRLTEVLEAALLNGVDPAHVIGTTFTVKAAGELNEKVRERLIESGQLQLAEQMTQALVGTVHSVCERLLKRFSFELGLSPVLNVMSLEDSKQFFSQALDAVLTLDKVRQMNAISARLSVGDWEAEVKQLADRVRENDVPLAKLAAMGKESADSLLAFFPPPQDRDVRELKRVVRQALNTIDTVVDSTKTTRKYLGTLRQSIYWLGREDCPWGVWIRLSTSSPAKKNDAIAAEVRKAASDYESNARFQQDIRAYIESAFEIASAAIAKFQELKTERGLIDFHDMEQLTLAALDEPSVKDRLRDELELLLVDEFQDTNPMQLALFIKLAAIADKVIFVGDVKQAIYAFRGCDPELVFKTLDGLSAASAEKDTLKSNYRSRPDLVHYVNEVFAEAFDGDIARDQVVLNPIREGATDEPAVIGWQLEGKKREQRVSALCGGLADLVSNRYRVVDPHTDSPRPVRWGDIAILARTNDHVEEIARALKDRRIPMKMTLEGLLATPEVYFARACLRRLNDVTDTLATAEIVSMADCVEPEAWLPERLEWVQGDAANYGWAEDTHPVIQRLAELRDDSALRSPVEIVARVVNDVHTRRIVTSWGSDAIKAAQRQRNLDAFLNLAVEYESHSGSHYEAASLTGFLFWLEHPSSPELDLQPVVTSGDAVHVLTYHRAKGLEWPVVIATDFESRERSNLWGVHVDLTADFDVNDPLANRTIRYWLDPFDGRTNDISLLDKVNQTPKAQEIQEKGRFEQRRLAYVGLTRARDLNVVALPKSVPQSTWLHTFSTEAAFPRHDAHTLPDGKVIAARFEELSGTGGIDPVQFAPIWYPPQPRTGYVRQGVSPSNAEPIEGVTIGEVIELGERMRIRGDDMMAIGSGLHAVIAAELVNPGLPDAVERARDLLRAWRVDAFVDPDDAVEAGRRCLHAIRERYGEVKIHVEYPSSDVLEGARHSKGWIDALVETDEGFIILDHKSSPRPKSEWRKEAEEYSGQLATYRNAVERTGREVIGTWIHFPVSGGLVEVIERCDHPSAVFSKPPEQQN